MNLKFFALVGIFLTIVFSTPTLAALSEQAPSDERPNYVVIGAFRVYKNAVRFTASAHKNLKRDVKFEMNPHRNLYYVYVLSTEDQELAINEAKRLREESTFRDTWVYFGNLGARAAASKEADLPGQDIHPVTTEKLPAVQQSDVPAVVASYTPDAIASSSSSPTVETGSDDKMKTLDDVSGRNFLFKVFRVSDNTVVDGDVNAIDTEKTRKIGTYKSNVPVRLPNSNLKQVSFVCEVFGYRKVQRDLDYQNPEGEGVTRDESGAVVIPFELMRLQKGDIAVMYNVYFFKDAAIMRPESRYEVNSLLEMLNENQKYRIKLHGHTNGNAAGKIISMSKKSENYFSLHDTHEGIGSAKQLAGDRAEVIRRYMISNGVDPSRIEVKAWGGKRPIHDKHSSRAQENVRVEVEILEDK